MADESIPPSPSMPNQGMLFFFQDELLPLIENPLGYHAKLVAILSIYISEILRNHWDCNGCPTCPYLDDLMTLAEAHNSLQFFNEKTKTHRPYPPLKGFTRIATTTGDDNR